jgi:3-hydroxyacyl-CoA dehydrogenase/3a,7a,12a-trihydroxy-5b-cholest-24-enoyl-CoA hydratase
MNSDLSFQDRVVLITGGGQGLGRAYALAFAKRGAKVMVNDLGISMDGSKHGPNRIADQVVEEIRKMGGTASANYDSVEIADKIVQETIKIFGRVDVLINNAGILRDKVFHKMKEKDFTTVYKVHLKGSFLMARCVWPYMREQNYGRIINTSSVAGIFGNFGQANYSAMKLGLVGLTNTLAREGEAKGIFVNTIAPLAATRMTEGVLPGELLNSVTVGNVVPLVEYLTHESCQINGALYEVGGGWIAKLRWQRTKGVSFDFPLTAENVRDRIDEINDFEKDSEFPDSGNSSVLKMFENFERNKTKIMAGKTSSTGLRSAQIFKMWDQYLKTEGASLVKLHQAVFNFEIRDGEKGPVVASWVIDLKNGSGSVKQGKVKEADGSFKMGEADFILCCERKLNPQIAFIDVRDQ